MNLSYLLDRINRKILVITQGSWSRLPSPTQWAEICRMNMQGAWGRDSMSVIEKILFVFIASRKKWSFTLLSKYSICFFVNFGTESKDLAKVSIEKVHIAYMKKKNVHITKSQGEAMCNSMIDFPWISTKTKSFQFFDHSTSNHNYLHQLWKCICHINTKVY